MHMKFVKHISRYFFRPHHTASIGREPACYVKKTESWALARIAGPPQRAHKFIFYREMHNASFQHILGGAFWILLCILFVRSVASIS